MHNLSLGRRHLVNAYEVEACIGVIASGGATPGRARSNALAKKLLPWRTPWLAPWLTEIFTFGAFAMFAANDLPYDRTDLEMTWLS